MIATVRTQLEQTHAALGGRSGRGQVVARCVGGRSVLASVEAGSPLRFLQTRPRPPGPGGGAAEVCLVTFGGGLVGGDRIQVDLEVQAGARLLAFTQSSTKVFRGASRQEVTARVDGTLVLLPDPVAAFADAAFTQTTDVTLGPHGAVVVLDGFTAGRAAFGERWAMRSLDLRTTIRNAAGRVVVKDALRLARADGSIAERLGSYDAVLTLIAVGQGARAVGQAILREPFAPPTPDLFVAATSLPRAAALGTEGAILRVAASQPAAALAALRLRLRNLPDIDIVDPFASRR